MPPGELLFAGQLLAAGLTAVVAWLAYRHRQVPGAHPFAVAMAAVAAWALLGAAEQVPAFRDPVPYTLTLRLDWLPIGVLAVAWLAFALTYTGREGHVTRRRVAGLSVVPAVTAFAALCHPLLIPEYASLLGPLDGVTAVFWTVEAYWGTIGAVGTGYTYLLFGVASLFLLELVAERPTPHVGQALVGLVVVPPWVLNAVHLFVFEFRTFDPTILGFTVSGVAGLFAVGRFRLFDVPLARARLVERLEEGVLVYGRNGRVYDYNDRAATLLDLPSDAVGTEVRTLLADSPLEVVLPTGVAPFLDVSEPGVSGDDRESEGTTGATPPGPGPAAPERLVDGGSRALSDYLDRRTFEVAGGGAVTHVETRVSSLSDTTRGPLGRVVLLYDVTERERRERELERKNEFLDEFAGVVSHDIATPLGVIENKAHLVEVTGDPSHVEGIFEATERIHGMVDDLRELARQGEQVGETAPVDLGAVAREAWQSVETRGATLTVVESPTVEADRTRLRQLLENLVENSVEHGSTSPASRTRQDGVEHGSTGSRTESDDAGSASASGPSVADAPEDGVEHGTVDGPSVTVRVGATAEGFYVADDGPGIPERDRENVFEQGFTTGSDGTGLGLAIVRRIADGHGWTVTANESDEGGARFDIDTGV